MTRNIQLTSAFLALSACAHVANADVSNQIYAVDQTATPSQTVTIPIKMKNSIDATAYSFSISLPASIDPQNVTLAKSTARKTDNVVFDHHVQSDNTIMALCYSTDGEKFAGNDGEVATVSFDVPANMTTGNYDIVIKESEISESGIAHRVSDAVTSELIVSTAPESVMLYATDSYTNATDKKVAKVTFKRTFGEVSLNTWQSIYIPFAFNVEDYANDFDVAELFLVAPVYDTDNNGVVDSNDNLYMVLSLVQSGMTYANAPYAIRPRKTDISISAENCILHKADINCVEFATSKSKFTVFGTFEPYPLSANDQNYYLSTKGSLSFVTKNVDFATFRWLMHEETKGYISGSAPDEFVPKHIGIRVIGEDIDEETALQFIQADAIQSCAGTDNVIYNLNGVRVDDTNPLPAGIYVQNGKTFMIR